jgi:tRNA/rRNA methyltransferase
MTSSPRPTPAIVLVEPQLAENIGMAARAMANFGLSELRLVSPRNGWPKKGAHSAASGASHILENAKLFPTLREAIADLHFVLATTARERDQMKRVYGPEAGLSQVAARLQAGERVGILFGRERAGLDNDEVSLADAIITFPVDPEFPSLNLAQSVLLVGYEWSRQAGASIPFGEDIRSPGATREAVLSFLDYLEGQLDAIGYFPADKRAIMIRNMRDIFHRRDLSEQDVRTLRGAIRALCETTHGKKI